MNPCLNLEFKTLSHEQFQDSPSWWFSVSASADSSAADAADIAAPGASWPHHSTQWTQN